MFLNFILFCFVSINAGTHEAVLRDDTEEQLVFIKNNIAKVALLNKNLKTAEQRGARQREACLRSKITALNTLEISMQASLSNKKINLDRVLRLRKMNAMFSKHLSEIESCKNR